MLCVLTYNRDVESLNIVRNKEKAYKNSNEGREGGNIRYNAAFGGLERSLY